MMRKVSGCMMAGTLFFGLAVLMSCSSDKDNENAGSVELAEKLNGKWIHVETNGRQVETDLASVHTFEKDGDALKAYVSLAMEDSQTWLYRQESAAVLDGNDLTLTSTMDDGTSSVIQMTGVSVSNGYLSFTAKTTITKNGQVTATYGPRKERFARVSADYSAADLVGTWNGYYTSDDPNETDRDPHQAVFRTDGTCNYYKADASGQYKLDPTVYSKYFVDGSLFSLCWLDYDEEEEEYENWEILSVSAGKITARAYHERDNGSFSTETYHLSKVE